MVALCSGPAHSQVLTNVEFSLSNPGARSLGLGGAFVALADDATAAFANPAGLVQLAEPEVSIEGRSWSYRTGYTTGGRASGEPTGLGIDTVGGPIRGESTADLAGLSFVSLVYPVGNWSLAFFQHQLLNFEMTQEIQGIFTTGPGGTGTWRGPIEKAFLDFEIQSRSLAAGYRVNDRLSLGFGVSNFDSTTHFTGDEYLPDDETPAGYYAASSFGPDRLSHHVRGDVAQGDWGLAGGLLWNLSDKWRLGAVYREGPELELKPVLIAGPVHPDLPSGYRLDAPSSPWHFPDVMALGLGYRSRDGHWVIGFEWTRVDYSVVTESLDPAYAGTGNFIDDANEIHVGGEYTFFLGTSVVAARLGAWLDPNHQIQNRTTAPLIRAELFPGDDEIHSAAGLGIAFSRIQLDFGIDLSQRRDTLSLSAIYSF